MQLRKLHLGVVFFVAKIFKRFISHVVICLTILLTMFMPLEKSFSYGYSIKDWFESIFTPNNVNVQGKITDEREKIESSDNDEIEW